VRSSVRIHAPGSVGNVGAGLDVLGLAVTGAGDEVELSWGDEAGLIVADPGHPALPREAARNTAAIAAQAVFARLDVHRGAVMRITKGLPLSGGQGGSAASAIAGAVAADRLANGGLTAETLLECALTAEATVAGRHLDNLAPSLLGGLVLVRSLEPMDVVTVPVPTSLRVVLVHPAMELATRDARAALPEVLPRHVALEQGANIAAIVAGALLGDLRLMGRGVHDAIAEPARAPMLPGFTAAKAAALEAGALGCSISGAGPTAFALADDDARAEAIASAMVAAYRRAGLEATGRVAEVDRLGAQEV
jgi:homoserine kinase